MKFMTFWILPLLLLLAGCGLGPPVSLLPAPPGVVAAQTTLDERALLGAELSYQAATVLMREAASAGFVDAALARKLAALDNRLFAVLGRARSAYTAANARSYSAAIAEATPLISEIWALVAQNRKASHVA
jgi:hypothetical protein